MRKPLTAHWHNKQGRAWTGEKKKPRAHSYTPQDGPDHKPPPSRGFDFLHSRIRSHSRTSTFTHAIGGPKRRMAPPACSASPSTSSAPADKPSPASSTSFSAPRQPRAAASASRRSSARCGLSIVAVALLWLTSLSSTLAILEAGGFVATPRFALVTREVEVCCFAQCLLPLLPSHSGTLN